MALLALLPIYLFDLSLHLTQLATVALVHQIQQIFCIRKQVRGCCRLLVRASVAAFFT